MTIRIGFMNERSLPSHLASPPDREMRAHSLAKAALQFFHDNKELQCTVVRLDLYRDNGVMLHATFGGFPVPEELSYTETDKGVRWEFKIDKQTLTETVLELEALEQSFRQDGINPLVCYFYCVD